MAVALNVRNGSQAPVYADSLIYSLGSCFVFIAAVLLAGLGHPRVLSVLKGEQFVRMGIVAELVERPPGIPDEQFAQQLIDAEGLKPWDGEQMNLPAAKGRLATKAVFAGDGREVIVYYMRGDAKMTGKVCRFRLSRGGMSDARWQAYRWCGQAFGLRLPEKAPPIVRMEKAPR